MMVALLGLLGFGAMLLAAFIGARASRTFEAFVDRVSRALRSAWMPPFAGIVNGALVLAVWGSIHEPGVIHDEQAYLLQAQIFASGQWTAPSPVLPEFFEQMHVFVRPAVFAKYPPGHAIALVPGIWLGWPGLIPILLTVLAGALVYWLMRHHAGEWTALIGWLLWSTASANLYWRASYLSEMSSSALWLLALWALTRWLATSGQVFLIITAMSMAACALSRPVTATALAVPLAFVVLQRISRAALRRQLCVALAPALAVIGLWPLWNYKTLGDPLLDPYAEYSRQYFPWDTMGFGFHPGPTQVEVPPEFVWVGEQKMPFHKEHHPAALPRILIERLAFALMSEQVWRFPFLALFFLGLRKLTGSARFALTSMTAVFFLYLLFPTPPFWTVYYLEVLPAFFLIVARGARSFLRAGVTAMSPRNVNANKRLVGERLSVLATCLLWVPFLVADVRHVRSMVDANSQFHRRVETTLADVRHERAIIFVHYPLNHHFSRLIASNDLRSNAWVVTDRGGRNRELIAHDPSRSVFRFDAQSFTLERVVEP